MSVKVAVSLIDNDRYMLGDEDTVEEFQAKDVSAHKKISEAEAAHERWFSEAKRQTEAQEKGSTILADARRHLEAARSLEPPIGNGTSIYDSRWSSWADSMYQEIPNFVTCQQVLHYAQSQIPFDHRTTVKDHKSEFAIYEKLISEEFPFRYDDQMKLADHPRSIPETLYLIHGRLASNVFYWHLRVMFRCQEDVKPLNNILEVGGGYGFLARLWMSDDNIKRYVIVDLPESLFFSEVCLRAEFGDDVGYWEGHDPGTRIVLVPVGRFSEYTAKSDLVINVGSLGEMSDSWVDFYMGWLDQYKPKYFYSLNYMGSPITNLFESRNFWAPHPSSSVWATRLQTADVPLIKMMCPGRDFVETIYEYAKPTRKFSEWSVLKGCFLNRATYLDGLELLRQDMTVENAITFINIITKNNDSKKLIVPKETLYIASMVMKYTDDPNLRALVDKLANVMKIGTH